MARKTTTQKAEVIAVKIHIEPTPATPMFYANYAEIAHSQHDFVLSAVRVPAKLGAARHADMVKTGVLTVEPEVQLTFPPTLVRPLIDALEKQLASFDRSIVEPAAKGARSAKK